MCYGVGRAHYLIIELFVLGHVSYVLSRRLNSTQLFKESFRYQNHLRNIPVARDVSYLPEEYYADIAARELQQLDRNNRNLMSEYRNLCETITKKVELNDDRDYEYQPSQYYEIYCKSYSLLSEEEGIMKPLQQKCAHPAFHCVQRSRLLYLVRRRWEDECWEPYTKEIASGCDCMWPVTNLGEISHHY